MLEKGGGGGSLELNLIFNIKHLYVKRGEKYNLGKKGLLKT